MNLKKIIQNASYLFAGNISIRLLSAISIILLARYLGPEEYGIFSIAIAISTIAGYFTDAGLSNTFMREVTKKDAVISELISSYFRVRIVFGVLATLFAYLFINYFYNDSNLIIVINWIVYPTIIGMTFMGVGISFFQAKERMGLSTLITVIQGIISATSILMGIILHWPLIFVIKLYAGSFIVAGIISILMVLRFSTLHKGWNKSLLDQLFIFTINGIIVIMLPQLGPIILEKVSTLSDVGYFSTAYKIPAVLYQVPGVIATAFYPRLFNYGNNLDYVSHRELSKIELKVMSFIGIGIAIPFIVDPQFWIISLLGKEWIKASSALAFLSFIVIFQSINFPLGDYLTTRNQQAKRTLVMILGLIVSIISYITLGKNYGLMGGAISAIITEVTLLIGYSLFINKSISFLFISVRYNLLSFIFSLILYRFLSNSFPLLSITLVFFFYGGMVLLFDRELFKSLKVFLANKKKNKVTNNQTIRSDGNK
ncbi:flippase [Bacillus sp. ISL-57]|uniref:flippase n=1 Tax=Bacillus sp. ISL-57 TaxID=2819135 RepID=UPI001BE58149|nr:flippase [Bacillus sp. ISL-57]MBT2718166.1 flippase [Bacillus sp. ISL-57]